MKLTSFVLTGLSLAAVASARPTGDEDTPAAVAVDPPQVAGPIIPDGNLPAIVGAGQAVEPTAAPLAPTPDATVAATVSSAPTTTVVSAEPVPAPALAAPVYTEWVPIEPVDQYRSDRFYDQLITLTESGIATKRNDLLAEHGPDFNIYEDLDLQRLTLSLAESKRNQWAIAFNRANIVYNDWKAQDDYQLSIGGARMDPTRGLTLLYTAGTARNRAMLAQSGVNMKQVKERESRKRREIEEDLKHIPENDGDLAYRQRLQVELATIVGPYEHVQAAYIAVNRHVQEMDQILTDPALVNLSFEQRLSEFIVQSQAFGAALESRFMAGLAETYVAPNPMFLAQPEIEVVATPGSWH